MRVFITTTSTSIFFFPLLIKTINPRYINWYLSKDQSHYLSNQIELPNYFFSRKSVFSPDLKQIASACFDNSILIWDAQSKKVLASPLKAHHLKIQCLTYSKNGVLASASSDQTIIIWDLNNGVPSFEPLRGHKDFVKCIAFSDDGCQLVSGGKDNIILLWNINTGRLLTEPMEGHTDTVLSVGFFHDGSKVCSGIFFFAWSYIFFFAS